MQQTFVKSIQGYDIEFNRLLYPTHYKALIRIPNQNPFVLLLSKNEGYWAVSNDITTEAWISPLLEEITFAILENEKDTVLA